MPTAKSEEQFQKWVTEGGYMRVKPDDLLHMNHGGFMRYAVDTIEDGVVCHKYGCGYMISIDPNLRYFQMTWRKFYWRVKLDDPMKNVRMYYKEKRNAAEEEVAVFRRLLQQLEAGEIEIVKKK
jgi:hypothetical protein